MLPIRPVGDPVALLRVAGELKSVLPAPQLRADVFATEGFLFGLPLAEPGPSEADIRLLNRLCKKVEVAHTLKRFYTPDLSAAADAADVGPTYAAFLCAVYLVLAQRLADPKFLNTALKMLDGTLRSPRPDYPDSLRSMARAMASA
jgi:hypothetical protein